MLKFKDFSKIELKETEIPKDMLDDANSEHELSGYVYGENKRLGIFHDKNLIGFLTPRKDGEYHRTGAIYIHPEYRGSGIGSFVISKFFDDKKGKSFISSKNISSQKAFLNAGFKPTGFIHKDGDDELHEYIKE